MAVNHTPPDSVRVRFAPSPTGFLHIGGLRTALYNYLFARQHNGTFVLRIEDTDQSRFVETAEQDILSALSWAGLHFEEGPGVGGKHQPYRQSERQELYAARGRQLIDMGAAYYAFDSEAELNQMREQRSEDGDPAAKYDAATRAVMRNSESLAADVVDALLADGADHVIRLKVPTDETVGFEDLVRGSVSFDTNGLDDQVLIKSDGLPTYHLANVVDDHEMGITHVIRGEEWLPSTPKHILLYRAFGWEPPAMAHLPLILSPNGGKLSKRSADRLGIPVSVHDYMTAGYLPTALLNFLAMLGWNPGTEQEVFALDDLVNAFGIDRVGSAGVQFNMDKLNWFNEQHLRVRSVAEIAEMVRPAIDRLGYSVDPDYVHRVVGLVRDRLTFPAQVLDYSEFFEDPRDYDERAVAKRWKPDTKEVVTSFSHRLENLEVWDAAGLERELDLFTETEQVGKGRIMPAVRIALSGRASGPGLFESLELIGKEAVLRRLTAAVERLG